jgi:hypothetical protein
LFWFSEGAKSRRMQKGSRSLPPIHPRISPKIPNPTHRFCYRTVNVTGSWQSRDWGTLRLTQAEGSRDVSGTDNRYELTGVVSGKELYLLFAKSSGSVAFCAILISASDGILNGTYSYRVTRLRLGHGLCQGKSYRLRMTKSSDAPAPHK